MNDDIRQEWATPDDFFAVINEEFHFDLDAAATEVNTKCADYIDPIEDALSANVQWVDQKFRSVWLNPGFAKPGPWAERAYLEAQRFENAVVVEMALISPSTAWWRDYALLADEIRLIGGRRVQYVPPPGIKKSSNSKENCLIIYRHEDRCGGDNYERTRIWTWDWTKPQVGG